MTAASYLPRSVFLAVSAAAHVAAFGALHPGPGREAAIDDRADVAVDVVPVEAPLDPAAPLPAAIVPPAAPSRAPSRSRDLAPPPSAAAETTASTSPALAPSPAPPVFAMTVQAGGARTASDLPSGAGGVTETAAAPFAEGDVSSPARRLGSLDAQYPPEARAQQIEGHVVLTIVVDATGVVADARVVRQAGYGLDESALRAVRGARFAPAVRGGRPVAVRMKYTVSFALQ